MVEAGALLEVADRELDLGVAAMIGLHEGERLVAVGDEGVVAPVGKEGAKKIKQEAGSAPAAGSSNAPTAGSTASAACSSAGKRADTYLAILHLACGIITWRTNQRLRKDTLPG